MAKSHIKGPGRNTIPRLELEAALDAVKMSRIIKQELKLQECQCFFWTDSAIALHSLHANCKRLSLFPRNRLQRILSHTKTYDWGFFSTKINPADHLTRGMTASSLVNDQFWFNWPQFLQLSPDKWPVGLNVKIDDGIYKCYDLPQQKKAETKTRGNSCLLSESDANVCCLQYGERSDVASLQPIDQLVQPFSSFYQLKLAVCWLVNISYFFILVRFKTYILSKFKKSLTQNFIDPITVNELCQAESNVIKYVQQMCFSQDMALVFKKRRLAKASALHKLNPIIVDGLLRVGGRLDAVQLSYDLKHPIILPECHYLTELIIRDAHEKTGGHCGVNATLNILCQKYWILNAKVTVRRVLSKCVTFKRIHSRTQNQIMAELPSARFQIKEAPFSHTGVDLFGPFVTKVKRSHIKRYACLFTCMTIRAIHLEFVFDLSTSSFINCLRRFLTRRGNIKHLYSDNATNFVGSERVLNDNWNETRIRQYLRPQKIEWSFNCPSASHTGGVWERMIRSVREILLTVMPKKTLTDDELH